MLLLLRMEETRWMRHPALPVGVSGPLLPSWVGYILRVWAMTGRP